MARRATCGSTSGPAAPGDVRAVPIRRPSEQDPWTRWSPGGESTTISRLLRLDCSTRCGPDAAGMPAYGSCAGMILLAREVLDGRPDQQQLGGLDVVVRRNAFGRQVDSFETDLGVEEVSGGPMRAVFIRAPWVESTGPGVQVLATVPRLTLAGRDAGRPPAMWSPSPGRVWPPLPPGADRGPALHALFCALVRQAERPGLNLRPTAHGPYGGVPRP